MGPTGLSASPLVLPSLDGVVVLHAIVKEDLWWPCAAELALLWDWREQLLHIKLTRQIKQMLHKLAMHGSKSAVLKNACLQPVVKHRSCS